MQNKKHNHIKKLELQLKDTHHFHSPKGKSYLRTRFVNPDNLLQREAKIISRTNNTTPINKSQFEWSKKQMNETNNESFRHRSMYDRPLHLLKNYLSRKSKLTFMPLFANQQKKEEEFNQTFHTINQFRIKKTKKLMSVIPPQKFEANQQPNLNQIHRIDKDYISFHNNKNLYQMTQKQLQESIQWKKHLLQVLNQRIQMSKQTSSKEKIFV